MSSMGREADEVWQERFSTEVVVPPAIAGVCLQGDQPNYFALRNAERIAKETVTKRK